MKSLTWDEVCGRRLARQRLLAPAPGEELPAVVGAVCGIQAQVGSAAELAIGARVAGTSQQDVRADIWDERRLVKTYGPRGTLHLLPADELPLWMAALRAATLLRAPPWYEAAGLAAAQADDLLAAIGDALDGRCLTREELAGEVAGRVGAWARKPLMSAWGELLAPAAYAGRLCFGPSRGSKVTFVRPDQWAGPWRDLDPGAALAAVCRRYVAAYGPVAPQDFARWFRLPPAEARRVLESLGGELAEVAVEGKRAWVLAADAAAPWEPAGHSLYLLPQYDCYVLGSGQRERVVPEAARARVSAYGRGRFEGATGLPVLLIDGAVAGRWAWRKRGGRIEVRVEPFAPLTATQRRQLDAEARRVGAFFGGEATLAVGALG
ncbi:MAG TPA: winged helix DNA-binding domain-containing protein [Thermomicrobiales bacterium]|nr:winged helix DNA-binding domain-containing protein [Thermomicrobiales bacterium]